MNMTATYDRGTVELLNPVALKHDGVTVRVVIPDEEIVQIPQPTASRQPAERADRLFRDLDAIRGATGVENDGVSDSQKLARGISQDPRYRV